MGPAVICARISADTAYRLCPIWYVEVCQSREKMVMRRGSYGCRSWCCCLSLRINDRSWANMHLWPNEAKLEIV